MDNNKKFKDAYSEIRYMQKKINEAFKKPILKEDNFSYPNMGNDINEDIAAIKENLKDYLINIDPKTGYKIYTDNVICYGTAVIKSIKFGFSYAISDEGCLIYFPKDVDSIPLYNEVIQFFSDLKQYYGVWKQHWIEKINGLNTGEVK